jgi:hypothetical protein
MTKEKAPPERGQYAIETRCSGINGPRAAPFRSSGWVHASPLAPTRVAARSTITCGRNCDSTDDALSRARHSRQTWIRSNPKIRDLGRMERQGGIQGVCHLSAEHRACVIEDLRRRGQLSRAAQRAHPEIWVEETPQLDHSPTIDTGTAS